MMRSVRAIFRWWVPGCRWHAFRDCHQLTKPNCRPVPIPADEPEGWLCWSCVNRLAR